MADTGHGMTEEVMRRALEPFFTTKGVGRGTGLGLSMAFGVARQSGGTLSLSSAPGAGTTVAVLLRCIEGESEAPRGGTAVGLDTPPEPAARAVAVMVIDDDEQVRESIVDGLNALGYRVQPHGGGAAALQARASERPALTVIDFAMPGLNGADIARQIRLDQPDAPIIFISGYADSAALDAFAGPNTRVLRKPFQTSELAQVAAELLRDAAGPA